MNFKKAGLFLLLPIACVALIWAFPHLVGAEDTIDTIDTSPQEIKVEEKTLVLNGTAMRTKFGFKVYQVRLYLTELCDDAEAIFSDRNVKRLEMTMRRKVTGTKFESTVRKNIKTNFSEEEQEQYAPELKRFLACFTERILQEGCLVSINFKPGEGTRILIDHEQADLIPGDDFHHALLRLWIGDPPQTSVREGLLGKTKK